MSNPWASSYDALRAPYLLEKKAKKDYDGDGKIESGSKEHAGVVHNAIQRSKGGKPDGKDTRKEETVIEGSLKQARKNVGASTCWKGYKAKGTKMKNGRPVPNCVKEDETLEHIDGTKTEIVDVVRAPKMVAAPKFSSWKEEMHWEALKGKKLDVKETGVKNKVEINPSIPTEEVQLEHHQKDEDGNVIEHGDGTPVSVEEGKRGLWDNIHAKKKRMKRGSGEKKAKPGDKDYPKTLNVEATFLRLSEKKNFITQHH